MGGKYPREVTTFHQGRTHANTANVSMDRQMNVSPPSVQSQPVKTSRQCLESAVHTHVRQVHAHINPFTPKLKKYVLPIFVCVIHFPVSFCLFRIFIRNLLVHLLMVPGGGGGGGTL